MRFRTIFILIPIIFGLILLVFFNYFGEPDFSKIAMRVEKYPVVERVFFIEPEPRDFKDGVKIGLKLKNGGHIVIRQLEANLKTPYAFITEIGPYRFHKEYYDFENKRKVKGTNIGIDELTERAGYPLRSLEDILNNYDNILAVVKEYLETDQQEAGR
ncbi:MAG: hypothetical protein LBG27_07845 [Spirochaetaceae bacterium]|jgi:hypothetical protein|nr:hypothetical protein [Spirochaetaceae bacterium]